MEEEKAVLREIKIRKSVTIFRFLGFCEKPLEKKRRVYVDFMDVEKAYGRVNREALWQVLRMYDVGVNF